MPGRGRTRRSGGVIARSRSTRGCWRASNGSNGRRSSTSGSTSRNSSPTTSAAGTSTRWSTCCSRGSCSPTPASPRASRCSRSAPGPTPWTASSPKCSTPCSKLCGLSWAWGTGGTRRRPWVGRAELPVVDAAGQPLVGPDGQPLTQSQDQVPFDARGQPLMRVTPDGPQQLGEPHATPEGSLVVDVLSPLEVRGEWGPTPWHAKRYHLTRTYLSCDEVAARWGVEVAPTVRGAAGDQTTPYLRRLLFSAGHFGAANGDRRMWSGDDTMAGEDFVEVTSRWDRGAPGQPGRLCVVSPERVLSDGVVPYDLSYTSPIRAFDFVRLPGRVHGSTPLEQMVPLQRAINRGWKQILEHRDLSTNPIFLVDGQSGLQHQTLTLAPGDGYVVQTAPGVDPLRWVAPPPLSGDVWRTQQMLVQTLMKLKSLEGTEGDPPTPNASGELVKELRFNSDRPLSPPLRRAAEEFGRLAADWRAMLPTIWDVAKTIRYAGEDNIVRVLTVEPHLWEQGSVDVVADVDSMLPESQGERQARVYRMWQDGMLAPGLPPQSAAAINAYLSLARFPHLGRAVRPGGPDRTMAEQTLGALLAGTPSEALPWFPWYDEGVHLDVLTQYMKRPDFLKLDPAVQQQMAHRYETLQQLAQAKQAQAQALAQMMALAATPAAGGPGAGLPGGVGGLPPLPLGGMPEPPRPAFAGVGQP